MHLVDITKENRWDDLYLSTDPKNVRGKHVYEKAGFRSEQRCWTTRSFTNTFFRRIEQ